ncbi:MAG: Bifunctional purine biosynthesis protein PurH [Firmicutes bacterium]|nr:Bifunctional purine biosynthesis protein PurH [Bacillota bacterium]
MKRALISVYDKSGVADLARGLTELGYEIISSGGTASLLRAHSIAVTEVRAVTGFPEMMEGRLKTLHPLIHGGILMRRGHESDEESAKAYGLSPIDIVVVNLYPFAETVSGEHSLTQAIENIDIGGPAMLRAAAKNYAFVAVVTSPKQYGAVLGELREHGRVSTSLRQRLAAEALLVTAYYDSTISQYLWRAFGESGFPAQMGLPLNLVRPLRYGENPHQEGALYATALAQGKLPRAEQLQGKELSYCNIADADVAWAVVSEFTCPAVAVVKHATPCGVATGETIHEAYLKAEAGDRTSIFGGIVALNREVDEVTAEALSKIFLEVVVAPCFTGAARRILGTKKNLRLLAPDDSAEGGAKAAGGNWEVRSIAGGYLLQTPDTWGTKEQWQVVTAAQPTPAEESDLLFAWVVAKHVKSNAIVIAKGGATIGIGTGQPNRIDAARQAIERAGAKVKGAVLASEAFFPLPDVLEVCGRAGIVAVIQPGGALRDAESIAVANAYGLAMLHTKERHFKH